jgi:hypothetical protein
LGRSASAPELNCDNFFIDVNPEWKHLDGFIIYLQHYLSFKYIIEYKRKGLESGNVIGKMLFDVDELPVQADSFNVISLLITQYVSGN